MVIEIMNNKMLNPT